MFYVVAFIAGAAAGIYAQRAGLVDGVVDKIKSILEPFNLG